MPALPHSLQLRFSVAGLLIAVSLTACSTPPPPPEVDAVTQPTWTDADWAPAPATSPASLQFLVGVSVEGREIACQRLGQGPIAVLYLATIHGNEAAGTPLLEHLAEYLLAHPELTDGVSVLLLPVANPDGMAANRRSNANGVDLNRNFPTDNWRPNSTGGAAPISQPESRALYDLIERQKPRIIVSLHQPLRCIDYDGPAKELAHAMAAACDLPVRKLGARPGSLGSYTGVELGIPTITLELPRSDDQRSPDDLWQAYGEMLLVPLRKSETAPANDGAADAAAGFRPYATPHVDRH